jgi:hypothetical protein
VAYISEWATVLPTLCGSQPHPSVTRCYQDRHMPGAMISTIYQAQLAAQRIRENPRTIFLIVVSLGRRNRHRSGNFNGEIAMQQRRQAPRRSRECQMGYFKPVKGRWCIKFTRELHFFVTTHWTGFPFHPPHVAAPSTRGPKTGHTAFQALFKLLADGRRRLCSRGRVHSGPNMGGSVIINVPAQQGSDPYTFWRARPYAWQEPGSRPHAPLHRSSPRNSPLSSLRCSPVTSPAPSRRGRATSSRPRIPPIRL